MAYRKNADRRGGLRERELKILTFVGLGGGARDENFKSDKQNPSGLHWERLLSSARIEREKRVLIWMIVEAIEWKIVIKLK